MRSLVFVATSIAFLGGSLPGRADQSDPAALLRRGVELRRQHRNAEALEAFTQAFATSPTPTARAQIALAEHALALWLEAERDLNAALLAADDEWITKYRTALEEAHAEIERHLAWLTVDVDVPGAEARLDGRAFMTGTDERVVSGTLVLDVRAAGHMPDVRDVDVPPGEHIRVAVRLAPAAALSPALPPQALAPLPPIHPSDRPSATRVGPMVVSAVGLASIGMGTYYAVHVLDEKRARDAQCDAASCAPAALTHDADARTSAMVSTAAIGAGLVSLAAGATWWALDASHDARHASPGAALHTGPLVLGALALAAAGATTYFGVRVYKEKSARDASCVTGTCAPAALEYDADARTSAALSMAFLGATIAYLAGGAFLWLGASARRPAALGSWHPSPRIGLGPAGVIIRGELE
jgi:hypothetical protein